MALDLAWQSRVVLWKRTVEVFPPTVTVWGVAQHSLFTSHSWLLSRAGPSNNEDGANISLPAVPSWAGF
jgi:hypothetical protein